MRWTIAILILLSSEFGMSQNLLLNGSFENNTGVEKIPDSATWFTDIEGMYNDIFATGPVPLPTWWSKHKAWNYGGVVIKLREAGSGRPYHKFGKIYAITSANMADINTTARGYYAMLTSIPIKINILYTMSYWVSLEFPNPENGPKYSTPGYTSNAIGFTHTINKPVNPELNLVYHPRIAYQMPAPISDTGWQRFETLFTPDSVYRFFTLGIFSKNYNITYKKFYPDSLYKPGYPITNTGYYIDSISLRPYGKQKPKIRYSKRICASGIFNFYNQTKENVVWEVNGKQKVVDSIFSTFFDGDTVLVAWNSAGSDTLKVSKTDLIVRPSFVQSELWCNNNITITATGGVYDSLLWLPSKSHNLQIFTSDTAPRKLILYGKNGCTDSLHIRVQHLCPPKLQKDTVVCANDKVIIKNLLDEPAIWSVNGAAYGSAKAISIGPVISNMKVKAGNIKGADSMNIVVKNDCRDEYSVYIPTAFAPLGTGVDAVFKPIVNVSASYQMKVYNLCGAMVFDNGASGSGWQASGYSSGFYVYHISISHNYQGQLITKEYKGKVLLVN